MAHSTPVVIIAPLLRRRIGEALVHRLDVETCRLLAVSVAATHAHLLAELPVDVAETRKIVGRCKGAASFAIRNDLPGGVWAAGGSFRPIKNRTHQQQVYHYILDQQGPDAWTWSFRDA